MDHHVPKALMIEQSVRTIVEDGADDRNEYFPARASAIDVKGYPVLHLAGRTTRPYPLRLGGQRVRHSLEQRREAAAALSPFNGRGGLGLEPDDPAGFNFVDNCETRGRSLQALGKHHCPVLTGKFPDALPAFRINDNPNVD